jgi:hypothetical protein
MKRSELLDELVYAEQDVTDAQRALAGQRALIRLLRRDMLDTAAAEVLLTDFECAEVLSIRNRDQLRSYIERLAQTGSGTASHFPRAKAATRTGDPVGQVTATAWSDDLTFDKFSVE